MKKEFLKWRCSALTTFLAALFIAMVAQFAISANAAQPAEDYANFTTDGGWCWFSDPRAVTRDGKTYAGWVTEDGSIQAGMLDPRSGKVSTVNLHPKYEHDDHDNPSFLFLPDARLMAFYSKHGGPEMNARVTVRPGDIGEWEAERVLDISAKPRPRKTITYSNPMMLSDETNAIYLFWRGDTWKPTFSKSIDGGQTWTPGQVVTSRPGAGGNNRPYAKYASNGKDRIHIIFTDGHPRDEAQNSVYYACYRKGAFYKADGTRIAGMDQLPFTPEQADCVYDAKTSGIRAWVYDVAADKDNRPVIAYTRLPAETDHRYHYARWDGRQWLDNELCSGGRWFPQTTPGKVESEPHYSSGLALDPANPSVVYLSRPVAGVREIEKWTTADNGALWQTNAITAHSKFDNIRPVVVRNAGPDGPTVLWLNINGRYKHYTDYQVAVKMDRPAKVNQSGQSSTTYHVDSQSGDDTRSGVAPDQAWKSLEHVNQIVFQPGDKILFKAGTRYSGQLMPKGSGRVVDGKPLPIVIGMYGTGAKPRIDGEGNVLDTLLLRNVEYWEVQDLEITNLGTNRVPWRTGVHIVTDGFGKMRHLKLRNLYVHDVNGDLRKSQEGCGIYFESKGGNESHFDDLLIENCHLERTDRNGICQRTTRAARSLHVVIRGNLLEDIGGDGIKPWGSNGALVEHNTLRGGRARCADAAAGIWPFDCDDTVIQFNEVSGMKGTVDGQGFDSDYRCRNSVFQYNYSHENDGGFMLICTPGNSWCEGTIIRYNISQNDGVNSARVFQFGGGAKNTWVYNNVIYIGPKQAVPLLSYNEWDGGNAENTHFINNIFFVEGRVTYQWDKSRNNIFENNVFSGNHVGPPDDLSALTNKPPLRNPGSGRDGFSSLAGYKLQDAAEPIRGKVIPNNGGRDFFGNPIPADRPPCIGVFEK